jgi:hypothetical protein
MFKFLLVTAVLATIAFFIWRHNQHIDAAVSQNKAVPTGKPLHPSAMRTAVGISLLGPAGAGVFY